MVNHLSTVYEALGSIPNTTQRKKKLQTIYVCLRVYHVCAAVRGSQERVSILLRLWLEYLSATTEQVSGLRSVPVFPF